MKLHGTGMIDRKIPYWDLNRALCSSLVQRIWSPDQMSPHARYRNFKSKLH